MCLSVARVDLGPADALLDLEEGLLVLRPTLTRPEQTAAARKALRAAGVRQSVVGVTCRCGAVLVLPPSPLPRAPLHVRASRAVSLLVAGVAAILAALVSLPEQATATPDPFDANRWRTVSSTFLDECTRYREPGHAYDSLRCSSKWGPVDVAVWVESNDLPEYRLRLAGSSPRADAFAVLRLFTTPEYRDAWVEVEPGAVVVGPRAAFVGPPEVVGVVTS